MLLGLLFSQPLLIAIKTPADLMLDSKMYLDIYIYGLAFVFFYNIATGIFSALGDSKTPFFFLVASSLSNIGVDIIFVKYLNMGVAGVAWATFICQGLSCVTALIVIIIRLKKIECSKKPKIFAKNIFRRFAIIAIPSILQQSFISIGNIIIQGVINSFGPSVMAGYSAGVKLNNLVITSFTTIGNGISNYASQNIGAGKFDRVPQGFKAGFKLVSCICVPIIIIYMIFPKELISFFLKVPSDEAIESATYFMRILISR